MIVDDFCANCIFEHHKRDTDNEEYLRIIRKRLDERKPEESGPYLIYEFQKLYEEMFHHTVDYTEEKKTFNDLVLSLEDSIIQQLEKEEDPLLYSIGYARAGNFIDYMATSTVDSNDFLKQLRNIQLSSNDFITYQSFLKQCENAKTFLLIADNCGEVVLDKIMLMELKKRFPHLTIYALVRGGDALNDVTVEDAKYVGLDKVATIISTGSPITGVVYEYLTDEAKHILDTSDVILAKGQGNYESLSDHGRHIFFSLLCKCEFFMNHFNVPKLGGVFVEETN